MNRRHMRSAVGNLQLYSIKSSVIILTNNKNTTTACLQIDWKTIDQLLSTFERNEWKAFVTHQMRTMSAHLYEPHATESGLDRGLAIVAVADLVNDLSLRLIFYHSVIYTLIYYQKGISNAIISFVTAALMIVLKPYNSLKHVIVFALNCCTVLYRMTSCVS